MALLRERPSTYATCPRATGNHLREPGKRVFVLCQERGRYRDNRQGTYIRSVRHVLLLVRLGVAREQDAYRVIGYQKRPQRSACIR
jgi:hypothetical protein